MSSTSAISALTAAYQTEIAKISDTLTNAEATYLLSQLTSAWAGQAKLNAKEISQYSISGRSFSYKTSDEMNTMINNLQFELKKLIYGDYHLLDASIGEALNIGAARSD